MHDILGGDKQLVQELLHDMKQEAASQRHAATAPAAAVSSTEAGASHKAHDMPAKRQLALLPLPVMEPQQRAVSR